jgi:glycosyltransferase involved in cell wall biosynthesis
VESVLAQSFGDFELVISDNASTDDTAEVVLSFGDPRIRYFRNDRNIGAPANWQNAVANALGRYCAIIGDDDRWAPTLLERLVPPLDDNPDVDVAFSDHWLIDADGCVLAARSNRCSQDYGRVSLQPGRHKPFLDLALHAQALLTTCALIRKEPSMFRGALPTTGYIRGPVPPGTRCRFGETCSGSAHTWFITFPQADTKPRSDGGGPELWPTRG